MIAVWASLSPGNIVLRLSWSLLLAAAMWYALVLGFRVEQPLFGFSDAVVLGIVLFAAVVLLQVPLWITKKCFRWRLSRGAEDAEQFLLEDRQFHLRHMFIAMFLWAVALSPLHLVLPSGNVDSLYLGRELFVTLAAAIVCNILITIPCIGWAFVSTARLLRVVAGWLFYCAVLTVIEKAVLYSVRGGPPNEQLREGGLFFVLNVSQCIAVFGTLQIFRAMGFRLVRFPKAGAAAGPA